MGNTIVDEIFSTRRKTKDGAVGPDKTSCKDISDESSCRYQNVVVTDNEYTIWKDKLKEELLCAQGYLAGLDSKQGYIPTPTSVQGRGRDPKKGLKPAEGGSDKGYIFSDPTSYLNYTIGWS